METHKFQAQESISKREAEDLQNILEAFESMPPNSSLKGNVQSLQLSLTTSQDKLKALSVSRGAFKVKLDQIIEQKSSLQQELEKVKEKYGKLREAFMKEREKAENAEDQAVSLYHKSMQH